ncbi:hypothetical protein GQ457_16G015210 [Hibiscus cannabinus]
MKVTFWIIKRGLLKIVKNSFTSLYFIGPTSNFKPQHPATRGVSQSVLKMNGEVVERAEPHIGLLQCDTKSLMSSWLLWR